MSREESLPPNYGKLDTALRAIGYSFEVAVADIIDNSIDARARNVLVRLLIRSAHDLDLAICDDGRGMDADSLKEAMRFGADAAAEIDRLGKFGLGLKLASLSQARELRVISASRRGLCARGWLEHGITNSFSSTVFDGPECTRLLSEVLPDRGLGDSGTVVWWSNLYRLAHRTGSVEERAQKLLHRLERSLALTFHRFLGGRPRRINISLDIFDEATGSSGIPVNLDPLDPFDYGGHSGAPGFPSRMLVEGEFSGRVTITAHVWPPNSTSPMYRLPGGANTRQGFYFYRNNRLIQGGGWNNVREAEPHSSLARLEIDIGSDLDVEVSLDVKKVEIQLPPPLLSAIQKAKTPSGIDFRKYLSIADEAYRKRSLTVSELPLIPSAGLPSELADFLHSELKHESTSRHRDLKFVWKFLETDVFFDVDRDAGILYLNHLYRRNLLHGLGGSSADVPVLKCLLFLLLEGALTSERLGSKLRDSVEKANRILVQAVKYERVSQ